MAEVWARYPTHWQASLALKRQEQTEIWRWRIVKTRECWELRVYNAWKEPVPGD